MKYTIYGVKLGSENRECYADSIVAAKLHATALLADGYVPTLFNQETKKFEKL
jgi:hypothetical protein